MDASDITDIVETIAGEFAKCSEYTDDTCPICGCDIDMDVSDNAREFVYKVVKETVKRIEN
jgi:hypothetical protein